MLKPSEGFFTRSRKKITERSPDWIGEMRLENGEEYDISGWDKFSAKTKGKWIAIRLISKKDKERKRVRKNPYEGMQDVG